MSKELKGNKPEVNLELLLPGRTLITDAATAPYITSVEKSEYKIFVDDNGDYRIEMASIGVQGIQGIQGIQGDQGIQGIQGIQGEVGPVGPQGEQGIQGIQGEKGDKGDQGIQGIVGPKGDKGDQGIQGIQGVQGDIGPVGPQGDQGIQGDVGPIGPQGVQGIQGIKGDTGAQGPVGPQGVQGETGAAGQSSVIIGAFGTSKTPADLPPSGLIPANWDSVGNPPADLQMQHTQSLAYSLGPADDPLWGHVFTWTDTLLRSTGWADTGSIVGPEGPQGIQGPIGPPGVQGPEGPQGVQGPQGIQGPAGVDAPANTYLPLAGGTVTGNLYVGINCFNSGSAIEIGQNRASDGPSYLDFHGSVGLDYGARIIRAAGLNGGFDITNTGTGTITLNNTGAGAVTINTSGVQRLAIMPDGLIGLGILPAVGPGVGPALYIKGLSNISASVMSAVSSGLDSWLSIYSGTNASDNAAMFFSANSAFRIGTTTQYNGTSGWLEKFRINANGFVGIGTTSPGNILDIKGASSAHSLNISTSLASGFASVRIGDPGPGSTANGLALHHFNGSYPGAYPFLPGASTISNWTASGMYISCEHAAGFISLGVNSGEKMRIPANGVVTIGGQTVLHTGNYPASNLLAVGNPATQALNLDALKQPGLYHYDGGFIGTKPPDAAANYRVIEMGSANRFSQIAMPWNSPNMYFRYSSDVSWQPWNTVIHDGNYKVFWPGWNNWLNFGAQVMVSGMLSWKNYGNSHVIFDASQGTSPTGSAVNNTNSANPWAGTYPTLMGWNGDSTYGVRVDSSRVSDATSSIGGVTSDQVMLNRGAVTLADPNPGTLNGFYALTDPGAGQTMLVFNGGVSTGPVQMRFAYSGEMWFRSMIDSNPNNWSAWKGVMTTLNIGSYAATLGGTNTFTNVNNFISAAGGVGQGGSLGGLTAWCTGNNAAGMSFHRSGNYAINFGLDTDNVVRFGGWSDGASSYRMHLDGAGNLTARGDVTAYSDIKLKDNIKLIDNALWKVDQIRGVTFTRKDAKEEDRAKRYAGVIAQEIELVLPEVVSEIADGTKTVSYGNLVSLLIKAIKELNAEKVSMRNEIDDLHHMLRVKGII